jgi:4-amino-4-deoxy-L-arabinose transferase-like glycosyltransferase
VALARGIVTATIRTVETATEPTRDARGANRRGIAMVFLAAFLIRSAVIVGLPGLVPIMPDKTKRYDHIAMNLLRGDGFSLGGRPTAVSPPLYPLVLAGVYTFTGRSDQAARLALALVDAGTCALFFGLASRLFSRRAALLTALCAVLSPFQLYMVLVGASDALFAFLVAVTLTALLAASERPTPTRLLVAGGAISLATLCRAVTLLFPLAAVPALWIASRASARAKLRSGLLLLAGAALVLTPWTVRNWHVFGRFVPVQTLGGYHLYLASLDWKDPADREAIRQKRPSDSEADAELYSGALTRITADPLRYARLSNRRLSSMWFGSASGALSGVLISVNSTLLALAVSGVWLERRRFRALVPLYALVLYFVAVHLVIASIFRYMMPIVLIVTMMAMVPCAAVLERVGRRS